jgi:hypothetical protein
MVTRIERLRATRVLGFALLLGGCAPPPIYRQPDGIQGDGGPPDGETFEVLEDGGDTVVDAARTLAPDAAPSVDEGMPGGAGEVTPTRKALLVVATPRTLPADDAAIKVHLEGKGFAVTVGDDDGPGTQADGMSLVVLSGSVSSVLLGSKYRMTPAPVLCLEMLGFGNMNMTGPTRDVDFGQVDGTQIMIVLDTHPIAARHPMGALTVATATTSLGWGAASATAERIAALVGMDNRATAFAYEAGAMMVGLIAPGRRVGLFPYPPTPDRLNLAGWDIFDAAIDWATR